MRLLLLATGRCIGGNAGRIGRTIVARRLSKHVNTNMESRGTLLLEAALYASTGAQCYRGI